jgi:hypothetical protein
VSLRTARTALIAVAVVAAVLGSPPAHADPTPAPAPIIPTPSGAWLPGAETWPPICGVQPRACALHYDSGTMTWRPIGSSAP